MSNDLGHVRAVMALLDAHGIATWLFGGWAEELHGLIPPRAHGDIDLLHPANDFAAVDRFLALGEVAEIAAKRFPHKRAFLLDGMMTEIFQVRPDLTTLVRGRERFAWPADKLDHCLGEIRIASPAALAGYRAAHARLHEG